MNHLIPLGIARHVLDYKVQEWTSFYYNDNSTNRNRSVIVKFFPKSFDFGNL
jgi:hypothetical protein